MFRSICSRRALAGTFVAALVTASAATASPLRAQGDSASTGRAEPAATGTTPHYTPARYWRNVGAGFAASILAHEAGHIAAAYAVGGHPYLGMEHGKPTVYSGLNATLQAHQQFVFSSAGLDVQAILDEAILDVPHHAGGPFERGMLAGGIATAYFYATVGRNASNSDITYMARTSSLSRTQASLIYVSVATLHAVRIARDPRYARFFDGLFVRPAPTSGLNVGVSLTPRP